MNDEVQTSSNRYLVAPDAKKSAEIIHVISTVVDSVGSPEYRVVLWQQLYLFDNSKIENNDDLGADERLPMNEQKD